MKSCKQVHTIEEAIKQSPLDVEVIGERLCFAVNGAEDLQLYIKEDGSREIAFVTTLENIEFLAKVMLNRVKETRKFKMQEHMGYKTVYDYKLHRMVWRKPKKSDKREDIYV